LNTTTLRRKGLLYIDKYIAYTFIPLRLCGSKIIYL